MQTISNSPINHFTSITERCMLNPKSDLYIGRLDLKTCKSLLSDMDNEACQAFWQAFAHISTTTPPKPAPQKSWFGCHDCGCPECGCHSYVEGCRCPNCDYIEG